MSAVQGPRTPATDFSIQVRTELPRDDYAALTAIAEQKHTTVALLVRECVRRQLRQPQRARYVKRRLTTPADVEAVRELNGRGYNDSRIGRELGFAPSTIGGIRKRLGLPKHASTGRKPSTPEGTP